MGSARPGDACASRTPRCSAATLHRRSRRSVFKTGGDAFCAAFHTASDALAAALEAQRASIANHG
jgi:class 3 adenylate cyclase